MPVSVGEKTTRPSFGEALRRERELRRIPLREVAESTKINIRYLEALERNDFAFLPGGAFTRGFIRSYARFIGTDETEMLNAYMDETRQQERHGTLPRAEDGGAAVVVPLGARARGRRRRTLLVVLVGLLLLAAGALAVSYVIDVRGAATWVGRGPPAGDNP